LKNHLLIVIEPEPLESFDNRRNGFFGRALQVSVFNPQQEFAADLAGVEPIEQSRTGGADVQIAGW
jgi:hypothetical protein